MIFGKTGGKTFFELLAIAWEHESERATEDDAVRVKGNSDWGEAEEHAVDNVGPDGFFGDSGDEAAVFGVNGAGGGEILPFFGFAFVDEFGVSRFEVGIALNELSVFDDAATDTS